MNVSAALGAGRYRKPWRIREFLELLGKTQADVARDLGKSPVVVNRTVRGNINNRAVLRHLRDMGCPEKYLSLPEDMQGEKMEKEVA
ncbi:MAG: helix-turn-helix transcriptional regulator [Pseudodesulfovibrio sp.]|nr:helix-turn-helix transcriptional regulator [Pseudodesulfovibrio sp.]